ncbi:A/G-specific adenine glycosylase [Corynebacterium sp. USCH3]|uniref:A/G-specific adenine glycosylase n=1 Tax=Corynebacterium sp. USCH3 TaxID=3024840 RepID=UPI003099C6D8
MNTVRTQETPAGADGPTTLGSVLNLWYDRHARDLPWRRPGTTPWAVLLSEIMSQQTPVARVVPLWTAWLDRWPTPAHLAEAPTDEILRAWANLGYPRRALRLRECARAIVHDHDGTVPSTVPELLALPGIGDYTARAVAAFAFGRAVPVVDTNVRRVHRRLARGEFLQGPAKAGDLADVADLMPWVDEDPALTRRGYRNSRHRPEAHSEALGMCSSLMELGATVCTARSPQCDDCPVSDRCRWIALGRPAPSAADSAAAKKRVQKFEGTDRQVRGRIMAILRAAETTEATVADFADTSEDAAQRSRALESLVADGLVTRTDAGPGARYRLPR